ncbi:LicD family-domain-containing protein [Pleurostoma richardsiae]|uniref:LicD family-domain-containing protein n=1 Tax=Pleurostoma richardsiae TaxID=41990 RepID=A0AA38R6G5_9PEZI|nr:LicD family-domain-containing protein [Pleurostoma richardsiae]
MKCAQSLLLLALAFLPLSLCQAPGVRLPGPLRHARIKAREPGQGPAKKKDNKYFHEPGGTDELGHYDARYFKEEVPYDEHRPNLRHLIRSYLTVFRTLGVETWLAHGTLLGWWWNGQIMPWDYDLDVQVSSTTLYYLGKNYNRTMHEYHYVNEATGEQQTKTYLLDINPHHVERDRGDGMNVIDARWIDLSNGMFIDITGLAERDPVRMPGIWSCKNYHRYRTRDLYPMRESEFEGVPATIPYSFDRILTEEYGQKSLVTTEWQGHRWEPELKEWVKIPEPPAPPPSMDDKEKVEKDKVPPPNISS